jgi:hypothetical protein
VTFYDHDWKYIRSFKRFKPYSPFILGGDGLFYGASRQNDKLISVLDLEGKLLRSFGELAHENGAAVLNSCELGISPEGALWVGMSALGKLIRFSRAGIIEAEVDISVMSSGFVRRLIKENLAMPKKGNSGIYPIIKSIDFMGEDVLVMEGGLVQPIFRIGSNGALKGSYYIPPQEGLIFYDMHVLFNERGEERFYLLRRDIDDDIRIGVYGRRSM